MGFYPDTIPSATKDLLVDLKRIPDIQNFYLSGGTALSLQLGHRESEDLDFFSKNSFQPELLQHRLSTLGKLEDVSLNEGTLNLFIRGVKLQFLYYPYNLLEEIIPWNGIFVSSIIDIACTKLITISMRGSKKDYVDLYVILQKLPLPMLFTKLEEKYKETDYNMPHILKSLVYFADAEEQPMPKMHMQLSWEEVKNFITQEVKKISF